MRVFVMDAAAINALLWVADAFPIVDGLAVVERSDAALLGRMVPAADAVKENDDIVFKKETCAKRSAGVRRCSRSTRSALLGIRR